MAKNENSYLNLTPKQQEFIQWIFDDGNQSPDEVHFKRSELKKIANDNGMAWAPAWIVKDTSRVSKRGIYHVPELADFIETLDSEDVESAAGKVVAAA
jgi:polysaccharide deacetylase 2 family uncharacterized protein YibQ|tara:strand:+ start:534 stop:827 length:294 start_codon:yes stop_codon:yes gene_type:complete